MDEKAIDIIEEIQKIKERLTAIEKEQRWIKEDIIKGQPEVRMKKRILEKTEDIDKLRKKIEKDIDIKI